MDIKFWHPEYITNDGKIGRMTVAYAVQGDVLVFAVSFCSVKEQFVKARGRQLAQERLALPITIAPFRRGVSHDLLQRMIAAYIEFVGVPHQPARFENILY